MCKITIFNQFIISLAGSQSPNSACSPRPRYQEALVFTFGLQVLGRCTSFPWEIQRITMTRGTDCNRKRVTDGICWNRVDLQSCLQVSALVLVDHE